MGTLASWMLVHRVKDDTDLTERYMTRGGNVYEIRFVGECPAGSSGRFRWFLFDVNGEAETTRRGVWLRPDVEIRMTQPEPWPDFSNEALCELMLLRLEIALEREERDGRPQDPQQPQVNFGYVFSLPESVNSMAAARAGLADGLEKSRQPPPIGPN